MGAGHRPSSPPVPDGPTQGMLPISPTIESAAQAIAAQTDDEKARAAAAAPPKPKKGTGPFVLYLGARNGIASRREIKSSDWRSIGCDTRRTDVWDLGNDYKLPARMFSDEQLDYLLETDGGFELVDGEGKRVDR